jgi:hypothetical protein
VKVFWLIAVTTVLWVTAAGAAVLADGPGHWLPSGAAAVLCLLPAVGTLVVAGLTERRTPLEAIGFILIAPLVRLLAVLALGGLLGVAVPELKASPARFVFWVAGFYLATLVTETVLLLTGAKAKPAPDVPTDS